MSAGNQASLGEAQARRLESVYEQLATLLLRPDIAARLRTNPSDNDWSAMQVVGHMVEMIPYWLSHCRQLMAAGEPPAFGRGLDAPERLAGVEHGARATAGELLRQLHDEVATATQAIRQLSPAERSKRGLHARRGEMSVADVVEVFIVVHAEEHLAQVHETLKSS